MKQNPHSSKTNKWKQQFTILLVSGMLGVSNILKNETKFIVDFKSPKTIVKFEAEKPAPILHPNLLWNPRFYLKKLFDKLNRSSTYN